MKTPTDMTSDEIHDELCALAERGSDGVRSAALYAEQARRPRVSFAAYLAAKAAQ